MDPNNPPAWLTPPQFAKLLCISLSTFQRRRAAGMIPDPIMFGERSPRWPLAEIRKWIDADCPRRARWKVMRRPPTPINPKAGKARVGRQRVTA